jgi:predicted nucleic acid-binding protein
MTGKIFFDTTILIYAVTEEGQKSAVAEALLLEGGVINVQVLNEFASVARKKLKMPWKQVENALQDIRMLCGTPAPLTVAVHESALRIAKRYGFNIYDALIVAAAVQAGCSKLYSEDLQHGQRIETLTVWNPFITK